MPSPSSSIISESQNAYNTYNNADVKRYHSVERYDDKSTGSSEEQEN